MKPIIKPFNGTFFVLLALIIALILILTFVFKGKTVKTKKRVLYVLGISNIVLWFLYKLWLFMGVEELNATGYTFDIFKELPLHLCNIALFLMIFGLIFNLEAMYGYCFYVAVFGALLAFVAPSPGFFDTSILSLHNIGYYGTHALLIITGVLLVTFGLFKPSYKGALKSIMLLSILAVFAHFINLSFLWIFDAHSDYFYTMHVYDISLLNVFWNLIPVKLLYLMPGFIIYGGLVMILTIPFHLYNKRRNG